MNDLIIKLEKLAAKQHRIFQDACDYGLTFEEAKPYKEFLKSLNLTRDPRHTWGGTFHTRGHKLVGFIPTERDGRVTYGVKVELDVNLTKDVDSGGYVTINLKPEMYS